MLYNNWEQWKQNYNNNSHKDSHREKRKKREFLYFPKVYFLFPVGLGRDWNAPIQKRKVTEDVCLVFFFFFFLDTETFFF